MARKKKRKARLAERGFDHDGTGHHARLRRLGARGEDRARQTSKTRKKAGKRSKSTKRSALMKRLKTAVAGAREQIRSFGRRKKEHAPKLVTEQTLRDHMALKCVRRCSH